MKKSSLVLALTSVLPGLAFAAAPVPFGSSWTLNANGTTIDYVCPVGMTCSSAPVTDDNFIQVQMTDASGNIYFQTVIATETGTTPADSESFISESFVTTGQADGGISANQSIDSRQTNGGVLTSSTVLNTGSFNNGTEDQVVLSQGVWDVVTNPEFHAGFTFNKNSAGTTSVTGLAQEIAIDGEFSDQFTFSQTKDIATGNITASTLDIVSGIVLNTDPATGTIGALTDQTFVYSKRTGDAVTAAGSASFPNQTDVTWVAGDTVERVLIGQTVDNAGDFGYDRVGNISDSTLLTQFSLASVGPFGTINPVDPFGAPGDVLSIAVPAVP